MKLDPKLASGPLVALVALLLVSIETADALRRTRPAKPSPSAVRFDDPALDLERRLAAPDPPRPTVNLRNPFRFAVDRVAVVSRSAAPVEVVPPPSEPAPVLTAIIWDSDPRAAIRLNGRDYIVKVNSQIADYQVTLIERDQVLLARGDDSLVLRLNQKGE